MSVGRHEALRNDVVAQKCSCIPKGPSLPVGFADKKLPYPLPLSPLRPSLRGVTCQKLSLCVALQAFVSPALALGTRCVCLLPLCVIDGSYLHGPRRAAVEVAVKPPDKIFQRLETACPELSPTLPLCILYMIPTEWDD